MNGMLQNKFILGLAGTTLVLCALLIYLGKNSSSRYQKALEDYRMADGDVSRFERLALYPSQDNFIGKTKALADYDESIGNLREAFAKYQSSAPERISPQEFGNRLGATNDQITASLATSGVTIPDKFYSGFESYTTSLAQSGATPVLNLQLGFVASIMADLAAAKPAALLNFRRVRQPEESGSSYEPKPGEIARPHNFEITFRASEPNVRKFLNTLARTDQRFTVIRILRITNENNGPPKSSTAQFGSAAPAATPGAAGGSPFGSFADFFGGDDGGEPVDPQEGDEDAPGDSDEPAPIPPPAALQQDGARMLAQVAGAEMLNVFISFDVMQFHAPSDDAPVEP